MINLLFLLVQLVHSNYLREDQGYATDFPSNFTKERLITFSVDIGAKSFTNRHLFGLLFNTEGDSLHSDTSDFFGVDFEKNNLTEDSETLTLLEERAEKLKRLYANSEVDLQSKESNLWLSKRSSFIKLNTSNLINFLIEGDQIISISFIKSSFLNGTLNISDNPQKYPFYILNDKNNIEDFGFDFINCKKYNEWINFYISSTKNREKIANILKEFYQAVVAAFTSKYGEGLEFEDVLNKQTIKLDSTADISTMLPQVLNIAISACENVEFNLDDQGVMPELLAIYSRDKIKALYKRILYDFNGAIMIYNSLQVNPILHFIKDSVNLKLAPNSLIEEFNFVSFQVEIPNYAALMKILKFELTRESIDNFDSSKEMPDIDLNSALTFEVWRLTSTGAEKEQSLWIGVRENYSQKYSFVLTKAEFVKVLQNVMISPDWNDEEKEKYCGGSPDLFN